MREIIGGRLWISPARRKAQEVRDVVNGGVEAVIDLAIDEPPVVYPRDIVYCRVPLFDSGENPPALLEIAVDLATSCLRREVPVMISCSGGMSRSPAIAAAAVARWRRMLPAEALVDVVAGNASDVSPALWRQIVSLWPPDGTGG